MAKEKTKIRAVREAQRLFQSVGYNGFSFQDLAERVGIKKGSLSEHFKTKNDLALGMLRAYHANFLAWIEKNRAESPASQLEAYFGLHIRFASGGCFCPLASGSIDSPVLTEDARQELGRYYCLQQNWMSDTLRRGQELNLFRRDVPAGELAELVFALGLGAQILARGTADIELIPRLQKRIFALVGYEPARAFGKG